MDNFAPGLGYYSGGNLGMRLHIDVGLKSEHSLNSLWSGVYFAATTCEYHQ